MRRVRLVKGFANMEHYSQDPFNPHPTFPQWAQHEVYPYPFWGTVRRVRKIQRYFMPHIENEYLRVTAAPDIGGRIWDIYDKIGRRHLANYNSGVRSYAGGFGLSYTAGGIENNYPRAHSCTTNTLREVSFRTDPDGSAAIVISEYERVWRTRWSMTCRLYPGKAYVEQRIRIYNRTPYDSRYMYWNNCGLVLEPNTQFIFPDNDAALHGDETTTFSWPIWKHYDMSTFRTIAPQPIGLYYLGSRDPFFGYYDHDEQFGLVHYGDLADVPGKKYWTWGTDPDLIANYRKTHHADGEVFGEVQAGRIVIQEHMDRVAPETECQWTERWYPVRDTGGFNGAGPGAALHVQVIESSPKRSRLRVRAMANASYPKARIRIATDGLDPVEQAMPLSPENAADRVFVLQGPIGPARHTVAVLLDPTDGVLATARVKEPNRRDSWREVIEIRKEVKPVGVEEMFQEAERVARDWDKHDLKEAYGKAIRLDPDYSPARRELGKVALGRGLYKEAEADLEAACRRDEDSLELRYFHGLALLAVGRVEDARKAFELACRYDWEARSLVRLAEMRMRELDWAHARLHLDRVAAMHPLLTRPRGLRAICLRKMGRRQEAAAEIVRAREADAQDPFLQYEQMFIQSGGPGRRLPVAPLRRLIAQVRGSEHPLLEAAFDYLSVSLLPEAEAVLRSIPGAGALVHFLLAHICEQLGKENPSRVALGEACRLDPTRQWAWHLEMLPVLQWAMERLPKNPRPAWHLGNLLMGHRRTEEAVALWRRAEQLGEKHYLLYASLGYYEKTVGNNPQRALDYFLKADRLRKDDLYVQHEIFGLFRALKRPAEARKYLEGRMPSVLSSPRICHDLLTTYLDDNDFEKFDAILPRVDFSINWWISGPHSLWSSRQIREALFLAARGKLTEAMTALIHVKPMPPNLGQVMLYDFEDERRFYHIGCICEKLGRIPEAREWWEKATKYPYFSGYDPAYTFAGWSRRYFHALCMQKLGRTAEADAYFDAMDTLARSQELPLAARERLMDLVERGRFGPENEKDPAAAALIEVATRAEL